MPCLVGILSEAGQARALAFGGRSNELLGPIAAVSRQFFCEDESRPCHKGDPAKNGAGKKSCDWVAVMLANDPTNDAEHEVREKEPELRFGGGRNFQMGPND